MATSDISVSDRDRVEATDLESPRKDETSGTCIRAAIEASGTTRNDVVFGEDDAVVTCTTVDAACDVGGVVATATEIATEGDGVVVAPPWMDPMLKVPAVSAWPRIVMESAQHHHRRLHRWHPPW